MSSPALKHDDGPKRLPMPLLGLLAMLFALSSVIYAGFWIYSAFQTFPLSGAEPVGLGIPGVYVPEERAHRVLSVRPGGPGERAGIKVGDRLIAINGKPMEEGNWPEILRQHKPGDIADLSIRRPGVPEPMTVRTAFAPQGGRTGPLHNTINNFFPLIYLTVGLAVLFLRLRDPNAWLMALVFGAMIAIPVFYDYFDVPAWIRPLIMTYRAAFNSLAAPLYYFFFAVFPERSPLDRRVPWLKWFVFPIGAAFALIHDPNRNLTMLGAFAGGTVSQLRFIFNCTLTILTLVSLIWSALSSTSTEVRRKTRVILWGALIGLLPGFLFAAARDFFVLAIPNWLVMLAILLLWLFPLSFAYAVVKHRVLEIPVLLRRSARYMLVQRGFVLLLVMFSIAITMSFALLFSRYLQAHAAAVPGGLALGAILGTVLFWTGAHVHKDVGRRIDRAFFRSAYDARAVLEDLVEKTRTATDRGDLALLLDRHLKAALQPSSVVVYFETAADRLTVVAGHVPPECQILSPADDRLRQLAEHGLPCEVSGGGDEVPCPGLLLRLDPDCLVPILGRDDRVAGVIMLGARLSEEPYSGEDKQLLASVANQAGGALESIRLGEKIAERIEAERRTAQEMEFARQVQTRLFPQKLPCMQTLEFTGACSPARTVGGDYYDFLELRPGRLALVLADIAGKGVPGALLMANLQANLRSQYATAIDDLPRLLASVNHLFYQSTDNASYATLFFADYDDSSRVLRYANCGHLPALLLRATGDEWLPATCTVLGLFEEWHCEIAEIRLAPGDTLLLYTDGITEATDSQGEEFGGRRLLEIVKSQSHLPVQQLMDNVAAAVRKFTGDEQEDDITLIVARCSQ